MFTKNLSVSLMRLCKTHCLSQERAAERCHISTRHFNLLLHRKTSPTIKILEKICAGFEISPNDLLLSDESKESLYIQKEIVHIYHDREAPVPAIIPVCPTCRFILPDEMQSVCPHCCQLLKPGKAGYDGNN